MYSGLAKGTRLRCNRFLGKEGLEARFRKQLTEAVLQARMSLTFALFKKTLSVLQCWLSPNHRISLHNTSTNTLGFALLLLGTAQQAVFFCCCPTSLSGSVGPWGKGDSM